jgi:chemosensory pili system protein ChpE
VLFLTAFGLGIAFCAPPGAITAEALRRGLAGGFRPALLIELGSLVGDATWAVVALAGVAVLVEYPPVRLGLGLVGVGFLFWLAWSALRDARTGALPKPGAAGPSGRGHFAAGAVISLGNPLNVAFWLGVGGAMVSAGVADPTPAHFVVFFAGFMSAAVAWCFVIAALIAWGRRVLSPAFFRLLNLACAAALAYFGLSLLWSTVGALGG